MVTYFATFGYIKMSYVFRQEKIHILSESTSYTSHIPFLHSPPPPHIHFPKWSKHKSQKSMTTITELENQFLNSKNWHPHSSSMINDCPWLALHRKQIIRCWRKWWWFQDHCQWAQFFALLHSLSAAHSCHHHEKEIVSVSRTNPLYDEGFSQDHDDNFIEAQESQMSPKKKNENQVPTTSSSGYSSNQRLPLPSNLRSNMNKTNNNHHHHDGT